jgi:hypothetical protein
MKQTVGTCSLCGGAVMTPVVWMGILPPTPTCSGCGALAAVGHGPVIPMMPAPPTRYTVGTGNDEWDWSRS